MLVSKTIQLRQVIGDILSEKKDLTFPQVITFCRGIEYPKYRITIDEIEEDFFVDSKGVKWIKAKDVD